MSSLPSTQDSSSSIDSQHSTTHEEDFNTKQILLNQAQSLNEALQEIDAQFDSRYRCYSWWLILMMIISGFYLIFIVAVVLKSMINNGIIDDFVILLLSVAFHVAFFAQYAFEKWAISTKDLAAATTALKITTFFSVVFLGLNVFAIYDLYDFSSRKDFAYSVDTAFGKATRSPFFIIASIISITQVFITHLQAIKVMKDLSKREAIKASLEDQVDLLPISALSSV